MGRTVVVVVLWTQWSEGWNGDLRFFAGCSFQLKANAVVVSGVTVFNYGMIWSKSLMSGCCDICQGLLTL